MKKSAFEIGETEAIYKGYAEGTYWNGWAKPWFTFDVAKEIMLGYNADCDGEYMVYSSREDAFVVVHDINTIDEYKGKDFTINGETLHLYPIGNCCWVWDDIADCQSKESKIVWDYLADEYFYIKDPKKMWQIYHGIISEINGYMSETEIKYFVSGFMAAWERIGRN